ncbi:MULTISPECIES: hypothetical protein [unclassified Gilliamella]|uniref:hypothetical protein n=1 Tax=unclassified Gilliamella TaxID=2685620 RepID=UPI00226AC80D|nr:MULTISPECIES: hypothetical protein [unclassified Gilliamella]MCX8600598.1 hypothetical protein [Gilliamella sp. B3722]MCX8609138.1 hypothetical protein [Gilliamella sp. B3771]MCX8609815.1 hypothetical protein [Gilliamella sp. B3891]MCX8612095.1 hypothetical protein [Gilliamella sp. B3773]MCX8615599.1 hypothetical protein [Gilliamella sp. B3770]
MKRLLFIFIVFMFVVNAKPHLDHENYGKWVMLTELNNKNVIDEPCYSGNRFINYQKGKLDDYTGQEMISCEIKSSYFKDGKYFIDLEPKCRYSDSISYEVKAENTLIWYLYHSFSLVMTNQPDKFDKVYETCEERQ